ncbi:alpha-L-rhamnosidase [Kineococcus sp. SYSU DK002]|uniref:alpha-L-rhamnosidase n=1 Tax=Kineococcus sp. SYSU DK002 TaxID=3383123 RepID=UPI003D7CED76
MSHTWQARFISSADAAGETDPAPYLRREFSVDRDLRQAVLKVSAIGLVDAHVNGTSLGDEVLVPGWTSYQHRLRVAAHDVTALLQPGTNALGAVLGQGWAVGRIGWENRSQHYSDRPALFAQLELHYDDRSEVVASAADGTWRLSTGGVRANSLYDGEEFDARLEPVGWDRPGFDDSTWTQPAAFDWNLDALIDPTEADDGSATSPLTSPPALPPMSPTAEPIRRTQELAPVSVRTSPSGKTVLDFGQILTGWVRLRVPAAAHQTITLRHAELVRDGEIDPTTLRSAQSIDRYTPAHPATGATEVPVVWEPRFTFHGFRYVEVDGWPGQLQDGDLTAVVVHSDMTRTGWFECSDELINQLHRNVVWSMRGNFVGVPTDCPQRDERMGWTGDINAFAPTAAFLFDVRGVLGSWLGDLAAEQIAKGFVPWVVPDVQSHPSSPTALWSDVAVSLPWVLHQQYGQDDVLRRAYPSMTAFVDQVESLLDENGLWSSGFQFGDWLDPDAPVDNPAGGKTDRHLVAAAYFAAVTARMAATARILGEQVDAARYEALATRVRDAFRTEYVTPSGLVLGDTVTAYSLAICFDLLEPAQQRHAGDRLAALVAKAGYTISTGFAGTPLVTDALSRTGHLEQAYLMLQQTSCPSFLYPVTMGATTIWERWDAIRPDGSLNPSGMTSLNHYALGAVADWLHRVVGGLEALEPGYRRVRIAPQPGGSLTSARVGYVSVHGRFEVTWSVRDGRVRLSALLPGGTSGTVHLPLHPDAAIEEAGPGEHVWEYALPAGHGERPEYSMDTPLGVLAADPAAWPAISAVFEKHLPGIPIDGSSPEAAGVSLEAILGFIPGGSPQLRADLVAALGTAAPEDDLVADSGERVATPTAEAATATAG